MVNYEKNIQSYLLGSQNNRKESITTILPVGKIRHERLSLNYLQPTAES